MILEKVIRGNHEFKTVSDYTLRETAPRVTCADGTTLSVQSGEYLYSTPRNNRGPYSHVEVGFPSVRPPDSWGKYFDGEWQEAGTLGSFKRLWKERKSIWYAFKEGVKEKRWWYFKRLLTLKDNATDSVYGYVPVGMVREFVEEHGGEVNA